MTEINPQEIRQMLADSNAPLDTEKMLAWIDEHPTFAVAAALLLQRNRRDLDAETRTSLQTTCAIACADRTAIADLADLSGSDWANFYPAYLKPARTDTDIAIDTFIKTYGHESPEEDALLEKLIFNPVAADYLHAEAEGDEQPAETVDEAPAAAVEPAPAPSEIVEVPQAEEEPQAEEAENSGNDASAPLLMESLASIFIKQRRYERALEIISNLSLKFPEKSAYFADQIRFLKKLIENQRRWEAAQASTSQPR